MKSNQPFFELKNEATNGQTNNFSQLRRTYTASHRTDILIALYERSVKNCLVHRDTDDLRIKKQVERPSV